MCTPVTKMIGVRLEARMLVDEPRGLEAIHVRHADVEQHHRELLAHQLLERLEARARRHQVLAELAQHRLVREQARRLVVDQQDVDLLGGAPTRLPVRLERALQRCSHIRTSDSS